MVDTPEDMEDREIELDLENPEHARAFLLEALPSAIDADINYVILEDGRQLFIKDMTDEECVQYAYQLLPLFEAQFPDQVNRVEPTLN